MPDVLPQIMPFISVRQSNIYTDTLTGMNNRRKAEAFLSGDVDPEMVIQDIRHRVAAECVAEHKPYVISLSIGFVLCEDPKRSITLYLKDADKKMYADKQGHYRQNGR